MKTLMLRYMKKLRWAEHIVMIFPVWWITMPAMTKGFVDKVIFPGVVYRMEGGKLVSMLSGLRQIGSPAKECVHLYLFTKTLWLSDSA